VRCDWDPHQPLVLTAAAGRLSALEKPGQGLRPPADGRLQVRFRQGGEQLQPAGRRGHHPLKKLFQEWAVPGWERSRVPLIYIGDELAAVAGLCVCEGFQAASGETGYHIGWSRLDDQFVPGRIVGRQ
jgi:tRNA(Ile)-lysidine synthase